MKSFKKLLSVLVVLAMLASFVPASTAASYIYEDQAIILNNLGLFKGSSATSFDPDLGGAVTREQGVIQLVRTLGKESDALAMADTDVNKILIVFSDAATISSWAKKYVAWAVNNKIVAGYPNGKFGPQDALSGKAYAKLILSALGHTVDAAGYEAACFLMRDKGILSWGTRGTLYYVLSFSEAQKFNDKEELIRDDLVALSYAALKLQYAANYSVTTSRNKTAIQVLVEAGKVTKDKAIAAYLYFKELMPAAEAAVAAYEAAPLTSLAQIATAEGLKAAADTAVAEYVKGNVAGLAAIVNFNVKFNLNNAWIKADYDGFVARINARTTAIANAKAAETAAQTAATTALAAYVAAPVTTLAEVTAAETLGADAKAKINACVDAAFKTAKLADLAAKDAAVAAAKATLSGQSTDANTAVAAFEAAATATYANIEAALALYNTADAKVNATQDPVAKAALRARLDAVALKASIKVLDNKTFQVIFNKTLTQAQKDATTVAAQFYTSAFATANTWSGNSLQVKKTDAQLMYVGDYTITVGGLTTAAFVLPIKVAAEATTTLAITSSYVKKAAGVAVGYSVKNQYGQEMTVAASLIDVNAVNLTDATRVVNGTALDSMDFSNCQIGDVIRINAYVKATPTVVTVADVTVANIYVQSVSLGAPVLPEGTTRFYVGTTGVKITATMVDNKGGVIKDFTGLDVIAKNVTITDMSNGVITFTLTTVGAASITVVNPITGTAVVQSMTIVATPAVDSVALTAPASSLFVAKETAIAFSAADQFGTAIPVDANFDMSKLNVSSSNPAVATVSIVGQEIKVMPIKAGTATITANVIASGKSSSVVVTVVAAPVLTPVNILFNAAPNTTLELTVPKTDMRIKVLDQFGAVIDLLNSGYTIDVISSNTAILTVNGADKATLSSSTAGITAAGAISISGVAKGTATVTVKLMKGTAQIGSSISATYTVVDQPQAVSMSITTTQVAFDQSKNPNLVQPIAYSVISQNGQTMANQAITLNIVNLTSAGRTVSGTLAAMDFTNCNVGDVVKISAYLNNNPAINTTANVTVVNPATVTLSAPSVAANLLNAGKTGVQITATVKSPSGEVLKSFNGLQFIENNITITSKDPATGKVTFTLGAKGAASLTVLNATTGAFVTSTFTIIDAAPVPPTLVADSVVINATATIIGDTVVGYTVKDQFGANYSDQSLPQSAIVSSSDAAIATVAKVGNTIVVTPKAIGSALIYVTFNGKTSVCNITVQSTYVPDVVTSDDLSVSAADIGSFIHTSAATLTYTLYDQNNPAQVLTAESAVAVTWTIRNAGTTAATFTVGGYPNPFTLAAGASMEFFGTVAQGQGLTQLTVNSASAALIVSAQATGLTSAEVEGIIFSSTVIADNSSYNNETFSGKVFAFDTAIDLVVIDTAVGYVVVNGYNFDSDNNFTVDGNTTATVTTFENNLSIGDTISVQKDRQIVNVWPLVYDYSINVTLNN